jgi:membrane protease YdiL (CAAX protease family)
MLLFVVWMWERNGRGLHVIKKIGSFVQSLTTDPLTFKKAIFICFYVVGLRFLAEIILIIFNVSAGIIPDIIFLVIVLFIARGMGRGELSRILSWRDIPMPVFAGIMVMFFGLHIISSELSNLLQILLPIPNSFFEGWFYSSDKVFITILTGALFPAFSEEILFRGIIARRFFRTYSLRKAVVLSALLFGLMHLNPWQAINAFYAGIFLAWIYWRYNSIWMCMFIHAYNNVLASFMTLPYVRVLSYDYQERWRHPIWFDILGLVLFGLGLWSVIVLSKNKEQKTGNK